MDDPSLDAHAPAAADKAFLITEGGGRLALPSQSDDPSPTLHGMRVAFAANTSWYLYNHHRGVLRAFLRAGAEVIALTPRDAYAPRLADLGCHGASLPMTPSSRNPLREIRAARAFRSLYRRLRPDVAFHFTIKCNLYGGRAAHALGIPYVNTVSGLGSAFRDDGALNRIVRAAYGAAQRRAARVFFQSPSDFDRMRADGLVTEQQSLLLPGSGVDLERFAPAPAAHPSGAPVFVFTGRLLREKGIAELATAMRRVRERAPGVVCRVYGFLEPGDSRFVTRAELAAWEAEGLLEYRGALDDVRPAYAGADCVVLPTYYREGVPKGLLEAAAMGKPIVTTTLPGCKLVVRDGVGGFLCEPRDPDGLAAAMLRILDAGSAARERMGLAGRAHVAASFGEDHVARQYLRAAAQLQAVSRP